MRSTWMMGLVIGLAMTVLFSVKITAFLAAGLLCAYGLLSGKISLASTLTAIVLSAVMLAIAELTTGIVLAYISDIFLLVTSNEGGLASRLLQGASRTFGISAPAALMALVLLLTHKWERLDHPSMWIFATVVAGIFFESQNTGGQELIFMIPVMVYVMTKVLRNDTTQTARRYTRLCY
ncbi:MAG: hypothetical protein U5K75_04905 [Ahrensia sp.]|nr:hypothetical protein [Ahrensia sp.]